MDYNDETREHLLSFYDILDVQNPVPVSKAAKAMVKNQLRAFGWEDGDPIPGNLKGYFSAVFQELNLPNRPASIDQVVGIEEVYTTVASAIKRVHDAAHAQSVAEKNISDILGPMAATSSQIEKDIREAAIKAEEVRIKEFESEPVDEEDYSDLESTEATNDTPEEEEESLISKRLPLCPCCHWDLTKPYDLNKVQPDEQKKFLAYVLGGPAFRKKYTVWNGLCEIVLKASGNKEEELFTEQYSLDYHNGLLDVASIAQRKYNQYHVALSLDRITYNPKTGITSPIVPSIWSDMFEPVDGKTRLRRFMDEWFLPTLPSFELQNILVEVWRDFNRVLIEMQYLLSNENFWDVGNLG